MSRQDDIRKLLTEHERRLHELEIKEAKFGINTPVEILNEMKDIKAKIERLQKELGTITHGDTILQQVIIYLQGDFSSLTADRKSAAIDAFAAVMGIPSQEIKVMRVYEGSIVFELGIPALAVQRLRSLLQSNSEKLRLLKVKRVILEEEPGGFEEWVIKEGRFGLAAAPGPSVPGGVTSLSNRIKKEGLVNQFLHIVETLETHTSRIRSALGTDWPQFATEVQKLAPKFEAARSETDLARAVGELYLLCRGREPVLTILRQTATTADAVPLRDRQVPAGGSNIEDEISIREIINRYQSLLERFAEVDKSEPGQSTPNDDTSHSGRKNTDDRRTNP